MPAKGYSTIGMKPAVISKLQDVTDRNYLGMFLPSTLIIMMNEIKAEVSGVVTKILVENAEPVEYGQAIFEYKPV